MKDERHQSEGNIRDEADSDDCEGNIGDNVIGEEGKDDKSGEEQEHGYEKKER